MGNNKTGINGTGYFKLYLNYVYFYYVNVKPEFELKSRYVIYSSIISVKKNKSLIL